MTTKRRLLLGVIDAAGKVQPQPVVAELQAETVMAWTPLDGCEPPATTPLRALLDLRTMTVHHIKKNA